MSIERQTVGDLLSGIAAKQPTPGGGAVAGVTLALAASLGEMVLNYSIGKKSLAEHAQLHETARELMHGFRVRAMELADADERAYAALNAIMARKDNPPSTEERDRAVMDAIAVPMEVLLIAARLAEEVEQLVGKTNRYLDSDLAMAAILADAAGQSAGCNVRINLPELSSESARIEFTLQMETHLDVIADHAKQAQHKLRK